jgi:hypothetical protein
MSIISIIKKINPFKTKRVLEYKGRFIPQEYKFPSWQATDPSDGFIWYSLDNQYEYCSYTTLEAAKKSLVSNKLIKHYI